MGTNTLRKYIAMNIKCAGWILHASVACGLAALVFNSWFSVMGAVMFAGPVSYTHLRAHET